MRIDSTLGYAGKRVCISIDDQLFSAFTKFYKRPAHVVRELFRTKIYQGQIENSNDAKLFIYSHMMKPSAFSCFSTGLPAQADIEDY